VILTIRSVLVRRPDLGEDDFEAFDPDQASSQSGPFVPRKETVPTTDPVQAPPAKNGTTPASPSATPPSAAVPTQGAAPAAPVKEATTQDLVLFMTPLSSTVAQGEQAQLTLMVSGGKGLDSGSVTLRVDPRLRLVSVEAGDFLASEEGSLESSTAADGLVTVRFRRKRSSSDTGALVKLAFETLDFGNAPVVIQSGEYRAGTAPLAARTINALVMVE
jgi:hypothetical protein